MGVYSSSWRPGHVPLSPRLFQHAQGCERVTLGSPRRGGEGSCHTQVPLQWRRPGLARHRSCPGPCLRPECWRRFTGRQESSLERKVPCLRPEIQTLRPEQRHDRGAWSTRHPVRRPVQNLYEPHSRARRATTGDALVPGGDLNRASVSGGPSGVWDRESLPSSQVSGCCRGARAIPGPARIRTRSPRGWAIISQEACNSLEIEGLSYQKKREKPK